MSGSTSSYEHKASASPRNRKLKSKASATKLNKARKATRNGSPSSPSSSSGSTSVPADDEGFLLQNESPLSHNSPLSDFLSPFRPASTQWVARYAFVSFALILRLAVGLGPYSGQGQEPLHGDFEAQRHWLELTQHLPMREWYFHDLEWWGLDYPPLTAYHSWLLGAIARFINPAWVALYDSRGLEDYDLKSFMRATALFSELAIYIPAVIWYVRWACKRQHQSPIAQSISASAILFQPALILIDHGHFQYNSVMLGFALLSIVNLLNNKWLAASFFFVLSITFKQMALYYSPVIFAYLLGTCVFPRINFMRLVSIGSVTVGTFLAVLAPLYLTAGGHTNGLAVLQQAALRVFPFGRGMWEDKVANVWCTLNTVVKLKVLFTPEELQRISLLATLAGISVPMLVVFFNPKKHLLPWAFAASGWAFYLFSFQVHEKSVLIPLMPSTLLIAGVTNRSDENQRVLPIVFWINNVAMFSMWPLLAREGLALQYFGMTLCWNWVVGNFNMLSSRNGAVSNVLPRGSSLAARFWQLVIVSSYAAMLLVHGFELVLTQTTLLARFNVLEQWPDLVVVLNVTLSCACFVIFWLWCLVNLVLLRNVRD